MSALQIEKLAHWHDCSLGCNGMNGPTRTRFRVSIIGRPLPAVGKRTPGFACKKCCVALQTAWDESLVRIRDEEKIAA